MEPEVSVNEKGVRAFMCGTINDELRRGRLL